MPHGKPSAIPSSLTSKFQLSSAKSYKNSNNNSKNSDTNNTSSSTNGRSRFSKDSGANDVINLDQSQSTSASASAASAASAAAISDNTSTKDNPNNNAETTAPPKRIKACLRCRKSKVKCINNGEAPCKRCKQSGMECVFQMKIESYSSTKVRPVESSTSANVNDDSKPTSSHQSQPQSQAQPQNSMPANFNSINDIDNANSTGNHDGRSEDWRYSMENKLENFSDTLNNILGFLKDGKFNNELPNLQVPVNSALYQHPHRLQRQPYPTHVHSQSQSYHHQRPAQISANSVYQNSYSPSSHLPQLPSISSIYDPTSLHQTTPAVSDYHDSNLRHPSTEVRPSYSTSAGPYNSTYNTSRYFQPLYHNSQSSHYHTGAASPPVAPLAPGLPAHKDSFPQDEVRRLSDMFKYPSTDSSPSQSPPSQQQHQQQCTYPSASSSHGNSSVPISNMVNNPANSSPSAGPPFSRKRKSDYHDYEHTQPQQTTKRRKSIAAKQSPVNISTDSDSDNLYTDNPLPVQKKPRELKSIISYKKFSELYDRFLENAMPQLFGFDISKFDKRLVYVKSELFVALVSLIGSATAGSDTAGGVSSRYESSFHDELKKIYLNKVTDLIFKHNKEKNHNDWGIDDEDNDIGGGNVNDKLFSSAGGGGGECIAEVRKEYDTFVDLCNRSNNNSNSNNNNNNKNGQQLNENNYQKEWRKWNLLTLEEKNKEVQKSKEFKLFINITALCIATFWFQNSQLLLGVAFQLASQLQLNKVFKTLQESKITPLDSSSGGVNGVNGSELDNSYVADVDKLKLWYLLYISDNQQSFLTKKPPMMNSNDASLKNSRKFLFHSAYKNGNSNNNSNITGITGIEYHDGNADDDEHASARLLLASKSEDDGNDNSFEKDKENDNQIVINENHHNENEKTLNEKLICSSDTYNDLKLVSQLEFNQALNLVLTGNAWDIMGPELFGMPWKTNLELDKWMVHWTCLLTPIHQGNSWSIKSTLIYYNFARMHINNEFVKQLTGSDKGYGNNGPPQQQRSFLAGARRKNESSQKLIEGTVVDNHENDKTEHDNGSDDEDPSHELDSTDIAILSAQSLVRAVTSDKDIIDNLRFAPIHIYVMSYYAALALLDSHAELLSKTKAKTALNHAEEFKQQSKLYFENLVLVRTLVKVFSENLPIDRDFGTTLVRSLKKKLEKKYGMLRKMGEMYAEADGNSINRKGNNGASSGGNNGSGNAKGKGKGQGKKQDGYDSDDGESIDKIRSLDELNEDEIKKLLGKVDEGTEKKGPILAWPGTNHGHP